MNRNSLLVYICCVLLCGSLVQGLTCGNSQCGANDACCNDGVLGNTCFDPNKQDCVNNIRLCGKGLGVCGTTCMDKSLFSCWNNVTMCPVKMQLCNKQCYDPSLFGCVVKADGEHIISKLLSECGGIGYNPNMNDCVNGVIVDLPISNNCSVGMYMCGGQCYDPALYSCVSSALKALPGVCGVNLLWCNNACYDPSQYNCISNALQPYDNITFTCPSSQLKCGNTSFCYDPSLYNCAENVICSIGKQVCGLACYDNNRYQCIAERIIARPGFCSPDLALCGSKCFNASAFNCVNDFLQPLIPTSLCSNNGCPSSYSCCADAVLGDVCYDSNAHDCVGNVRLCASGFKTCGTVCFDSSLYTCAQSKINNALQQLCPLNFDVCGDSGCFNSSIFDCVGSLLCNTGSPVCNGICYNNIGYSCLSGVILPKISNSSSDSSDSSDDNSNNVTVVCLTGQHKCLDICFSPDTHACLNDVVVVICAQTMQLCGTNLCYDPNTHNCTNNIVLPLINCDTGNQICGILGGLAPVCYDPDHFKCVNGSLSPLILCDTKQKLCNATCYDFSVSDCIDNLIVDLNYNCTVDTLKCGDNQRCFDSTLYKCEAGHLFCLNLCGNQCYDYDFSDCIEGKIVALANISCPVDQTACGTPRNGQCFDPHAYICYNNTLACVKDFVSCNKVCFDPKISVCKSGNVVTISHNAAVGGVNVNLALLLAALLALLSFVL